MKKNTLQGLTHMLEGLDSIDWSQMRTAYGHPEEIPVALRHLFSEDAYLRSAALGTLQTELTHQGSIYDASVYVVPFLLEILALPDRPDERSLVEFLADLGSKGVYLGTVFQDLETRLFLKEICQSELQAFISSAE